MWSSLYAVMQSYICKAFHVNKVQKGTLPAFCFSLKAKTKEGNPFSSLVFYLVLTCSCEIRLLNVDDQ